MTWPLVPLGDIATFAMGQAPPSTDTNSDGIGIPFYRSGEFGGRRPIIRIWTTTPLRVASSADVFICVVGANSGEVNLGADGAIGRSVAAIMPCKQLDQRYLFHFLTSRTKVLRAGAQGSAQGVITKKDLSLIDVPLPPLEEQRRIVGLLEDHLSRLDAAEKSIRRSLGRLVSLRDAVLSRAVEVAYASSDVEVQTLGNIAKVSSGLTPLKGNKAFYEGGTIPWITSGDLHQGLITEAKHFVTQAALDKTTLKLIPAGAVLIAMYGEGKTRGTAAELGIDATTNQACAAVVLHDPDLRPWVRLVLDANYGKLRRLAAGGVQPNLNQAMVKAIEIPIPAPSVRRDLLTQRADFDDARSRLQWQLTTAQLHGARLRRSLLAAAFSGRLTGTASDRSVAAEMIYT